MSLLSAKGIGKAYIRYAQEWKRFSGWFGLPTRPSEENWVLRDINFEVKPGEAIGVIGQNGAGKSTLLKMIAGTMQPTEGKLEVNGLVSAILELGMSFNPDMSGRQNALHTARLMGFTLKEIQQIIPQVEAFADIGKYFDAPVRTYSSGMQMRVAFAIATAKRPDILIVDEALAVGDAAFQRKCFHRIEGYISDGTALLLVTHDLETVKKICTRVLFLANGRQQAYGSVKSVCEQYERYLFGSSKVTDKIADKNTYESTAPSPMLDRDLLSVNDISYGDGRAVIKNVWFENNSGNRINVIKSGDNFVLKYTVFFNDPVLQPVFAFLIKTLEGVSLYGSDTQSLGKATCSFNSGDSIEIAFKFKNSLSSGTYFVNCGVRDEAGSKPIFIHRRVDVAMFKVTQNKDLGQAGLVNLSATFSCAKLDNY